MVLMVYLALLGLVLVYYLGRLYSLDPRAGLLLGLMFVLFYVLSRRTIASYSKRLVRLRKDHERLRLIYESESRDTEILHVLDEISASFMEDKNLDSIFQSTLDGIQKVLKAEICALEVITEEGSLVPKAKLVRGVEKFELNENVYDKVLLRGSSLLINNLNTSHGEYKRYRSLHDQGIQAFLIAPLKIEKKAIGLLGIFSKGQYDFTGEELRRLSTFATHASLIIENARLLETTQRLSVTDELTQLYNYRRFRERFVNEFNRAKRYKHKLSLLMCDIDYFKNYNDTNGHEAGNEVLKKVASIMKTSIRDVDFVARWGGEEFTILLVETDKDGAGIFAERLRQKIEDEDFPFEKKQPKGKLTITIGISAYPGDAKNSEELINRADEALYRGKKTGRNRVVAY